MVGEMAQAARDSMAQIRSRISEVTQRPIEEGDTEETFTFRLDGSLYLAFQRGRNRDVCLGFHVEADKGIALRCLLDGDAEIIEEAS
jgi:hypothetical protein